MERFLRVGLFLFFCLIVTIGVIPVTILFWDNLSVLVPIIIVVAVLGAMFMFTTENQSLFFRLGKSSLLLGLGGGVISQILIGLAPMTAADELGIIKYVAYGSMVLTFTPIVLVLVYPTRAQPTTQKG
ncbi:MAG: hypothetical protein FWG14_13820 [Peptococcaceae bacterium]|nr:hypothetical protein [Peptococcaceae bacterium]